MYYSLSAKAIVTPATILSRCAVSAIRGSDYKKKAAPGYSYIPKIPAQPPTTPSKGRSRPSSPLKKSTRFSPESDDDADDSNEDEISNDPDRNFYCRLAVDPRRGVFFDLNWERHRAESLQRSKPPSSGASSSSKKDDSSTWGEGAGWDVVEQRSSHLKEKKKKTIAADEISESEPDDPNESYADSEEDDDDDDMEADDGDASDGDGDDSPDDDPDEPRTPSRKRGRGQPKTPRKRTRTVVQPTPHSKAALARRKQKKRTETEPASPRKRKAATFAIRFPEQSLTFQASMAHLPRDPWLRAMHALHVGSRPDVLPCREDEYARVLRCVGELLEEGSGGCVCECVSYNVTVSC